MRRKDAKGRCEGKKKELLKFQSLSALERGQRSRDPSRRRCAKGEDGRPRRREKAHAAEDVLTEKVERSETRSFSVTIVAVGKGQSRGRRRSRRRKAADRTASAARA
ncbi:hypothetical protein TGMAS_414500 [Toxoplasma gondii MAS]|uniref:Uncharacterized protein n=1 Tax=Toxoplasma gondii MAS TaxID=943118 RepID=A0A086PHA1_TOXGO|nr:hypothetical protein TGMAS_414500 [Toxoplasma gondii MAS]